MTWTSSSTSVATVSTNGLVTGVAEGTATITATSEGVGGTAQVVVTAAGVASVDVQPSAESVIVGGTVQLTATPRDAAGGSLTGRTVTWSSSDDAIATVDGNGLVATAAVGEATITATSEGTSGSATITVLPVPVASVTVTPNPAQTQVAATVQLTAELKDADDNVLDAAGRTITWSSSDDAVATVDDAGEVTGVALGMATITATAEGQSGTADVDVIPDNFSPGADTNISGTQDFNEVNIPAGVTVTVTDDLVMNVAGDVTIDGTLSGDCVGIAINGEGNVTIRGDVMNGCDDGVTDLPDMSIVGDGDLTLDGGTIEYAGNLELSNDPTLDDSAFPAPGVPSGPDYYRAADASQAGDCRGFTHAFVPKPPKMAPGADGIVGGPGTDAKTWVLRCRGNAFIDGNVKVFGQDGGDGGKGTHEGALSANATGGPGGKGGKIRILVTGNLTFSGAGNEVVSGDGGAGGAALARGFFDVNPDPAWGATATGGAGAEPGLVDIRSTGGFIAIPGELTVRVGTGGAGGASDAFGGQGAHADERAAKPAQIGGDATAIGGLGGSSLQLKLQASGSVSGRANVDVEGGDGGKGGSTNADAGDGGDGNELFIDGAAGGILDATGGFGGDGLIRDLDDMPVSLGGDGGDLFVGGANGGFGWVDCIPPTFKKGGEGGPGGIVNGQRGEGGLGNKEDGEDGEVVISDITGNGGDGGDGLPEGGGGAGGIDLVDTPRIEAVGPNFEPGFPGIPCPVRTTRTTSLQLNQIPSTQGVVPAGTHVVDIIDDLTQQPVGTMPLTTLGPPNNHFFGSNPDRIGVSTLGGGSGHGWRLDVGNVDIPHDVEVEIVSLELCSINPIGIGPSNPMQIQLRDAGDNLVEQILINDPFAPGGAQQRPGCVGVMIPGEVAFVSLLIGQQAQVDMLPPDIDFFMLPPVAEQ